MKLRKEFNDRVQEVGNRLYDGLGDVLTKKVRLATPLAIAGAFALTALAGHGVCQSMYNSGIVQGMYSDVFPERLLATFMAIPYQVGWVLGLPFIVGSGAVMGHKVGSTLDSI